MSAAAARGHKPSQRLVRRGPLTGRTGRSGRPQRSSASVPLPRCRGRGTWRCHRRARNSGRSGRPARRETWRVGALSLWAPWKSNWVCKHQGFDGQCTFRAKRWIGVAVEILVEYSKYLARHLFEFCRSHPEDRFRALRRFLPLLGVTGLRRNETGEPSHCAIEHHALEALRRHAHFWIVRDVAEFHSYADKFPRA